MNQVLSTPTNPYPTSLRGTNLIYFSTESGGEYEYDPHNLRWRRLEGPGNIFMSREDGVWHEGFIPNITVGQHVSILDAEGNTTIRVTTHVTEISR